MPKYNPLIFSGLDLTGGGPAGAVQWKSPVATESALPMSGNSSGDVRVVVDTDKIYIWDSATSRWVDTKFTLAAFGSTPNPEGLTVSSSNDTNGSVDLIRTQINLEPADSTNPGAVSTSAQNFAGDKTFDDDVIVAGGLEAQSTIDAQAGIDSTTGTLDLGTGTAAVNIGDATGTTDIVGTVTIEYNPADVTDWAPAPTHVIEGLDQLADRFVERDTVTKEPTGFPNRTDSVLSFNDSLREFTITPTGLSFDYYVKGKKFTVTTAQSIVLPNLPGDHYIYFNDAGVLSTTQVASGDLYQNNALISIVYWNTDTNTHTYFAEERHGLVMDGATHTYLHTVFGARYLSGLALQGFTIGTGGNNADAQFTADQGTIRDEDILIQIPAALQIPILYRQGQQWRKKTADAFPMIYSATAGYVGANGRLPYNQYTGGAWQLTEVANNKYVLVHFFGTNDIENGIVGIQGITEYASMEAARTGANAEISSLSGLPFAEFVAIGTVLFQTANTFVNTPKADVIPVDGADYVDFRGTQLYTPAGNATTHSLLSGLGADDHFQYLLADGTRPMSGALSMGTHQINNVVDPTSAQDASTKAYTDQAEANANAYTDGREIAITSAYEAYTDAEIALLKVPEAQRKHVNYVSGNDTTGNGSILSPWKTVSYACTQITDASISKRYVIEFDGVGSTDVVSLPAFVALVGKNMSTSQILTVNCTLPSLAQSLNTIMNATITNYNLDSTAVTSQQSTRFFDCTILNLNCVGRAIGGNQVLLYSTDVTNQLHFKGGYLQVAAPNYLQRVRIFHTTNSGSTNYALIQGGQQGSQAGTWISGNGTLQLVGGVSMNVPTVTWGEVSTGVFRGRVAPFSGGTNNWTTDVTISIQNAATEVILTGNGTKTINTLISDWNTANPTNLMTLVEGVGTQVVANGAEIVFRNGAKPAIVFDSSSYVTESASIQGPVTVVPNARPEGIKYDDRARASYYGFRFYATNYGTIGNSISLVFNGSQSVSQVVSAWNAANPSNTVAYSSNGDATARGYGVIPAAATITLSGGGLFTGTSSTFSLQDAIVQLGQSAQAAVLKAELGIMRTTFSGVDNQATPDDIDNFVFPNASNTAFEAFISITRGSTYAEYSLKGIKTASSWLMSQDYIGDDTGVAFSITSAGQIQYTSTAIGTAPSFIFRAFRI